MKTYLRLMFRCSLLIDLKKQNCRMFEVILFVDFQTVFPNVLQRPSWMSSNALCIPENAVVGFRFYSRWHSHRNRNLTPAFSGMPSALGDIHEGPSRTFTHSFQCSSCPFKTLHSISFLNRNTLCSWIFSICDAHENSTFFSDEIAKPSEHDWM